jgi:hypothetical protein
MTKIGLSILASIGFAAVLHGGTPDPVSEALSGAPDWRPGILVVHTPQDMRRVDSAMAPVLESYGLEQRTLQDWLGPQGRVRASVFRMRDSSGAYGLFSVKREPDVEGNSRFPFGADGFRTGDRAVFWSGAYVVELGGDEQAVNAWAALVAPNLRGASVKPAIIGQLPVEARIPGSERFLAGAAGMGSDWGVDPLLLGFEHSAEAAVANYRIRGKTVRLLLLTYPTPQLALRYAEVFTPVSGTNGRLTKRMGTLLAVADQADEDEVRALLESVRHEFQITRNEAAPEEIKVARFVVSMIKGIGALVGLALLAGGILGGIRIYFRWRYPHRIFDRASQFEMIQLKLNQDVTVRRTDGSVGR